MIEGVLPFVVDFLSQSAETEPTLLFRDYAQYLLTLAGCTTLPIDLNQLRKTLAVRTSKGEIVQRGFTFGNRIMINEGDLSTVQRFTEAHEFMEMLVTGLFNENVWRLTESREIFKNKKEGWCDYGATELLMPYALFLPLIDPKNFGIENAMKIAKVSNTSLLSTLRRMLDADLKSCLVLQIQCRNASLNAPQLKVNTPRNKSAASPNLVVKKSWKAPQVAGIIQPNERLPGKCSFCRIYGDNKRGKVVYSRDNLTFRHFTGLYDTQSVLVSYKETLTIIGVIELPAINKI